MGSCSPLGIKSRFSGRGQVGSRGEAISVLLGNFHDSTATFIAKEWQHAPPNPAGEQPRLAVAGLSLEKYQLQTWVGASQPLRLRVYP